MFVPRFCTNCHGRHDWREVGAGALSAGVRAGKEIVLRPSGIAWPHELTKCYTTRHPRTGGRFPAAVLDAAVFRSYCVGDGGQQHHPEAVSGPPRRSDENTPEPQALM